MSELDKNAILSADDKKVEQVDVPEWGGHVHVRTLTGTERDAFESAFFSQNGTQNLANIRSRLAVLTVCDARGKRLFADTDVVAVGKKSAAALDRVFGVAQRLNGLRAEDVKELEKNSEAAPSGASGSDSPPSGDAP